MAPLLNATDLDDGAYRIKLADSDLGDPEETQDSFDNLISHLTKDPRWESKWREGYCEVVVTSIKQSLNAKKVMACGTM